MNFFHYFRSSCALIIWVSTLSFASNEKQTGRGVAQYLPGDIIVQTSSSKQSWAIMWATKSVYSHIGIIDIKNGKPIVIEAAFAAVGINLGVKQKIKDLDFDNFLVRKLFKQRWKQHPVCSGVKTEEACWPKVLDTVLVTPDTIATDPKLKTIFSTY